MSKQNRARTRATRQRMAETGETYTQAARRVGDTFPPTPRPDEDRLSLAICSILQRRKEYRELTEAAVRRAEAEGLHVVDGGPEYEDEWTILDWRTQEVLASGTGGDDAYFRATERLAEKRPLTHIDPLMDSALESERPRVDVAGVPIDLIDIMEEWVHRVNATEIARLIGWNKEDVVEHLGEE